MRVTLSHIWLLAESEGSHVGEGRRDSKIALVFQESGDTVAEIVSFYSVSIDVQITFIPARLVAQ